MDKRGILTVVSGFSGSGKGSLMRELVSRYDDNYALSVSATTRAPREGEVHGREYYFVSTGQFDSMIKDGEFIEYARYVDNYYGTPKKYVLEQLESGRNVLLEIEIQGALKVREQLPDALLIFVTAPSVAQLRERLKGRGTESDELILSRLRRAAEESEVMSSYDYILINDDLSDCTDRLHGIIQNERMRTVRCSEFIHDIQMQLKQI